MKFCNGLCRLRHFNAGREATGLRTMRLADVEPEPVKWLWPGRIPFGKLTVLDGDPGLGKSSLTIAVAAAVTTGRPLPGAGDERGEPGDVLLISPEDGLADTLRPRLDSAGANVKRVHAVAPDFRIPDDIERLGVVVRARRARLVVIDPIMSVLGNTDGKGDQAVRRALQPLVEMAQRTGCAVVLVRHLTKATSGPAVYRGGGSIGIVGLARSALVLAKDPNDPGARILAQVKPNLAAPAPALRFRLKSRGAAARIEWGEEVDITADELLQSAPAPRRKAAAE